MLKNHTKFYLYGFTLGDCIMGIDYTGGTVSIFQKHIDIKTYKVPYKCGPRNYDIDRKKAKKEREENNIEYKKRSNNLGRARQRVFEIVNANVTPHTKFLTLTCRENILDYVKIKRMFTTFVQAMKREGYQLRYVGVLEHQINRGLKNGDKGAYHIHLVVFNNEKIPFELINKHWDGFTDIHVLNGLRYGSEEKIRNVGAYVCKYITKEACTEYMSHVYFCSKGLLKPIKVSMPIVKLDNGEFVKDYSTKFYDTYSELLQHYKFNKNHYSYEFSYTVKNPTTGHLTDIHQKISYSRGDLIA